MPGHIYKLLRHEAKDALQKYNLEAIQKLRPLEVYMKTNLIHDIYEHTQDCFPSSVEEQEFHECQEYNTDQDLEPPTDDLLDSQEHSENQLDQVLQTYQAYHETQSESQTHTRQMNAQITYHFAQGN